MVMDNRAETVNVSWVTYDPASISRGYWDQALLEDTLADRRIGYTFEHIEGWGGNIVVIPGRFNTAHVGEITARLNELTWAVLVVTSDEEGVFPWWQVSHPNMRLWVQTPRRDGDYRVLPLGYPTDTRPVLQHLSGRKSLDWFFAGQDTHERRHECVAQLRKMGGGELLASHGFTQGLPKGEYLQRLSEAKIAPCPAGPVTPDTFRMYEALEAGCLPVVDAFSPNKDKYWGRVFPNMPMPVVQNWGTLPGLIEQGLAGWPAGVNRASSWWSTEKRGVLQDLRDDIETVSHIPAGLGSFTVLIPTSPIPAHPSTDVIAETIRSIRDRTDAEIIVMCDGVRAEQEHLRAGYEEYQRKLWWLIKQWEGVHVVRFEEHLHQAEMTRRTLKIVDTEQILFVEHDTPLIGDIPFDQLSELVGSQTVNVIRLHHEASILPVHRHLMVDQPWTMFGVRVWPTLQWSQRPHLARADWYRGMLEEYFPVTARTMIEDRIHGVAQENWARFRVAVFLPEGDVKRSGHLDARGGEPKFEMRYQ